MRETAAKVLNRQEFDTCQGLAFFRRIELGRAQMEVLCFGAQHSCPVQWEIDLMIGADPWELTIHLRILGKEVNKNLDFL